MGSNTETFTFEEVAKDNNGNDRWIIVNGKVYNVTPFLDDHPGGDEALVIAAGSFVLYTWKDATITFEDIGHSTKALEMMERYFVGVVDTTTLPIAQVTNNSPESLSPTQAPPASYDDHSFGFVVEMLQYVLPLLVLILAFALRYFAKTNKSIE